MLNATATKLYGQEDAAGRQGAEPATLSVLELQKILRVSRTTAYRLVHGPEVPFTVIYVGKTIRIVRTSLMKWLDGS